MTLDPFLPKKQDPPKQDPCTQRRANIELCEQILRDYPNIPIWKLIEKFTVESGFLRETVEDYFKIASKRIRRMRG